MGFNLQAAGPGAIVSIVLLSIIIAIRITGFAVLQYGRWKYFHFNGRFNGSREISVILTIRDSKDPNLKDYIRSILINKPEYLYITTPNRKAQHRVDGKLKGLRFAFSDTKISVGAVNEPNRRREIAHALASVDTPFTALTDQGVHWPEGFLKSAMLPFASHRVGCVTVPMMARKRDGIWGSFSTCLISCYYSLMAERNRALNALDGSVVFQGSPILFRTKLVAQPRFKQQFEVDPCLNRRHGVHKADEYLFFNRYFLQEEAPHEEPCAVVFQDMPEATVRVDRGSVAEFIREYLQMTRNLWRLSRVMIRRNERIQYPIAFFLTHLVSFVSFPLMYEILFILLVHFTMHLGDDEWVAWDIFAYLLIVFLAIVGIRIIRRLVAGGGYGFSKGTPTLAVMVGYPVYYVLGILRLVALATAWKADVELMSEDEIKVRVGDPEALRYSVNGAEEARAEIDEPPWISNCMELERPRRPLRPLPDFPLYVIAE
ncbi:hypothetical protein FNAPI_6863 [Fusarium napiforme]|uniref:Ceramide glucosyltransferase n=1 Tax=Fusarium napiforme TaxID=42672 RepID=A0A8H5JH53_9HYPO|nr:hypothetical protein FNAPI_6863 [Fusarium napiforme]